MLPFLSRTRSPTVNLRCCVGLCVFDLFFLLDFEDSRLLESCSSAILSSGTAICELSKWLRWKKISWGVNPLKRMREFMFLVIKARSVCVIGPELFFSLRISLRNS